MVVTDHDHDQRKEHLHLHLSPPEVTHIGPKEEAGEEEEEEEEGKDVLHPSNLTLHSPRADGNFSNPIFMAFIWNRYVRGSCFTCEKAGEEGPNTRVVRTRLRSR